MYTLKKVKEFIMSKFIESIDCKLVISSEGCYFKRSDYNGGWETSQGFQTVEAAKIAYEQNKLKYS